jgi:hypothetical protein
VDVVTTLDWRDADHWSYRRQPCVHCSAPTHTRDTAGKAAHKICAERVVDEALAVFDEMDDLGYAFIKIMVEPFGITRDDYRAALAEDRLDATTFLQNVQTVRAYRAQGES